MLMKRIALLAAAALLTVSGVDARDKNKSAEVNDFNTPLHLLQPDYPVPYGIPQEEEVTDALERVLTFLEKSTPMNVIDGKTKQPVTDYSQIKAGDRLQQGAFRLASYEWGVTYAGMLAAGEATGNRRFTDYTLDRMRFLTETAGYFQPLLEKENYADPQLRQMLRPQALDDCGAMCVAFLKALPQLQTLHCMPIIDGYIDCIMNQYRLPDGTLARNRPIQNSIWLDDMFMSLPALSRMTLVSHDKRYLEEACRQYQLFVDKMFIPEKGLFRHGRVEGMAQHPSFFWARANGWALMTTVEMLDVMPENHYSRPLLLQTLEQHAAGLLACQSETGLWHQLLDRPDSYLETSATAIYAYSLAKAIRKGWLDAQAYGPAVLQAWNAVSTQITAEGKVTGTCVGTGMAFDAAFYYARPVNEYAAHGYGPVLLAGAEVLGLLRDFHPRMNDSAVQFYSYPISTDAAIFSDTPENRGKAQAGESRRQGRPVIFTIGDSTVKNGDGSGRNGQWGWGAFLGNYIYPDSATVENFALGGRSSRTYIEEGLWKEVLQGLQPGDYVLIQFGHNDGGDPGKGRARATLKGNGDESQPFVMETTGKTVDVHTYGWYMRQYLQDALDKGAIPIVCSLIPRNMWNGDRVIRNTDTYVLWARQAVEAVPGACFIDLNTLVSDKYDVLGQAFVDNLYHGDHTHTSLAGAQLNAAIVSEALRALPLPASAWVKEILPK